MTLTTKLKALAFRIATGRADEAEFEGLDYADVIEAKTKAALVVRARASEVWKAAPPAGDSRKITYVASSEHVDRMGDIIRVYPSGGHKGWLLDNIKANPVGLWCHESWLPPIASIKVWRERKVEFRDGSTGPALLSEFDYHSAEENPAADVAYKLAKKGALRAVSVGFKPLAVVDHPDRESRLAAGLGPWGVEFVEQDLHEVSSCSVPANPYALEVGVKSLLEAGEITEREAQVFAKVYPMTEAELVERVRDRVRSFVDFGRANVLPAAAPGHKLEDSVTEVDEAKAEADRAQRIAGAKTVAPATNVSAEQAAGIAEELRQAGANAVAPVAGKCVELTIRVRGTDAVREAVKFLFASGAKDFRSALEGAAHRGIAELAFVPEPDPDGAAIRIPDADVVAANVPAETRKAVSAALSNAFEQLSAAQDAISAVIDVMEDEALPVDDVAAAAHAGDTFDAAGALELAASVRDLVRKINRVGGEGGATGPSAGSDADVGSPQPFDITEAKALVASLKTILATPVAGPPKHDDEHSRRAPRGAAEDPH